MERPAIPPALIALGAAVIAAAVVAVVGRPEPDDIEAFFDGGALGPLIFAARVRGERLRRPTPT